MDPQHIRALAAGFAPVIHEFVRDEIRKANAGIAEEVAHLRAELSELRIKLEGKVEQPRSGVRRIA
jgi:hypothetical protein